MQKPPGHPTTISWQALEFNEHKKPPIWFISFGLLSALLIFYGFWSGNLLTGATFLVICFSIFFLGLQRPQTVTHKLSSTGISANRIFYPYRNIKKFWIIYKRHNKTLNFETVAYLNNQVSFQLGDQDPVEIKQFLKKYLPEDLDKEESLMDIFAHRIKF